MASWKGWLGVELNVVSTKEKVISVAGGFLSIVIINMLCHRFLPFGAGLPLIASMGASAVLLFAVPHGPLSQPWPVIAGHCFSAAIGVACAKCVPHDGIASALAVSLAIGAMHQFKCIHPPGGATAMMAVIGGPAIRELGFQFAFGPVLLNALAIVGVAILFNSLFHWRRYPAVRNRTVSEAIPSADDPTHEEVIRALRSMDSFMDITEEDLLRLSHLLRKQTMGSRRSDPSIIPLSSDHGRSSPP